MSDIVRSSKLCMPNRVDANDDSGNMVTGDSGEELGEGSVRADESAVDMVVVGDESVLSDA